MSRRILNSFQIRKFVFCIFNALYWLSWFWMMCAAHRALISSTHQKHLN
jgi:hypothetical protein